ncbi:uncharacterized protein LOC129612958 [Condylostylus longicornis]|uniref:uncharacterized protein LOC129612958 n=1 Tax=Condylostylus longicornis TaxID=2530218 RepID=UPI00244E087B|nr:uncharacterized protein LOC129612958 [Condylostylus longicornis]
MESHNEPRISNGNNGTQTLNRPKDNDLKIATWNVRTMLQIGKMQEVANEMAKYKIDLMALQEIRWANKGKIEKPQYTLFYSGSASGRRTGLYGTGFMINKKLKSTVMAFEPVNVRISMIRLKGKFCNITIVTAYAPIEDADAEDKDIFYENLMGREQHVVNIAGKYSLHEVCNNNGQRLCQFADEISMKIKSTAFERKNIYKGTWKVPGSGIVNQIDHVLITTRRASSIIDVRSCRGANCDSDHYLVRVTVRQRISNITKQRGKKKIKWNTEKLLQPTVKENYQEKIQHHLFHNVNSQNETIENMTENIEKAIISAATEIVGKAPTQRNSEWFDSECKDAIEIKNEERKKMLQRNTRAIREEYKRKRVIANKICKKKKKQMMKSKKMTNGYQPRLNICRDKPGNMLLEENKIMSRWVEYSYFKELLNVPHEQQQNDEQELMTAEPLDILPTFDEIKTAIFKLKNNKAPGEDNVTAELLKMGGEELQKSIHRLICNIWQQETIPEKWNMGLICPIHKKVDKTDCNNYRGITLLNCMYKVLSNVIYERVKPMAEEIIDEYQCGFRGNRSTVDQIFLLRQNMEKCYEHNVDLHLLFIDYKQAFDSGAFEIKTGVRQGDALSALMFNLLLQHALGKLYTDGNIFSRTSQIMAYADDVVIIGRSVRAMCEAFVKIENETSKIGLKINEAKTKYLEMSRTPRRRQL